MEVHSISVVEGTAANTSSCRSKYTYKGYALQLGM
jgi:hypothetical protein